MKTKLEILEETKATYNKDNRGVNLSGGCKYLSDKNTMCAVGRCMTETSLDQYKDYRGSVTKLNNEVAEDCPMGIDLLLKEEYRGHEVQFWQNLQEFHDEIEYWNETGLSELGEKKYKYLVNLYTENTPKSV